jgi:hypothetical protein
MNCYQHTTNTPVSHRLTRLKSITTTVRSTTARPYSSPATSLSSSGCFCRRARTRRAQAPRDSCLSRETPRMQLAILSNFSPCLPWLLPHPRVHTPHPFVCFLSRLAVSPRPSKCDHLFSYEARHVMSVGDGSNPGVSRISNLWCQSVNPCCHFSNTISLSS